MKKNLKNLFSRRRKVHQRTRIKYDLPSDLTIRGNNKIVLHEEVRFCNYDGELIKKLGSGTVLVYAGKKINKAWGDGTKWLSFLDESGVTGIINPVAMVNCFTFIENEEEE